MISASVFLHWEPEIYLSLSVAGEWVLRHRSEDQKKALLLAIIKGLAISSYYMIVQREITAKSINFSSWVLVGTHLMMQLKEWKRADPTPLKATQIDPKTVDRSQIQRFAKQLKKHIVGQNDAVKAITPLIQRAALGLNHLTSPTVLLFLGPTGVGKTEMAKTIAHILQRPCVRINLGEYQLEHHKSRLVGAPPGYIAYGEGGVLTNALAKEPRSIILFDEAEKAHKTIWDLMLGLFDAGELMSGEGKRIDGTQAIYILTSNLGAGLSQPSEIKQIVQNKFRPEFVGRLSEQIIFQPLKEKHLKRIFQLKVEELIAEIKTGNWKLQLQISKENLKSLAEQQNYHSIESVRQVVRKIDCVLREKIAQTLLNNQLNMNGRAKIALTDGKIRIIPLATSRDPQHSAH